MTARRVVGFGVAKRFERRHLHVIACHAVVSHNAAVADISAKRRKEVFG